MMDLSGLPQSLVDLLRGYAVLCPTRSLHFPTELSFSKIHGFLLHRVLLNPHFAAYPPSLEYQKIFWKWALEKLENLSLSEHDEIDARMYEHSISLLNSPSVYEALGLHPPTPSYFTYIWPSDDRHEVTTLMESRTTIESGTTGMKTWRASLILSQYLIQNLGLVQDKSILELGSGVGFIGLTVGALHLRGASMPGRIRLTDTNPHVLKRCDDNISLPCNKASQHHDIRTQELDWTDSLDEGRHPLVQSILNEASADVIIGADLVFDPSIIPALVGTLEMALNGHGKIAIIALTVRNKNTLAEFLRLAEVSLIIRDVRFSPDASFWGASCSGDTDHGRQVKIFKLRRP